MKNYKFTIHGNSYDVTIKSVEDSVIELEINGSEYKVEVDKIIQSVKTPKLMRSAAVPATDSTPSEGTGTKASTYSGPGLVKSPLPATILEILVHPGDVVKVGQKLMVLEAMKMENSLESDRDGKVISVKVIKGQNVMEGDVLIEIGE
jgi:glutaconyl-CoA/methylmalonyl-CoA decarboxylase subunit gamma